MAMIINRRAKFDYDISDQVVAGLVLHGPEVKSLRKGSGHLKGAFVNFKDHEAWLVNAHIGPYKFAKSESHESMRTRKLLLTKKQISKLENAKKTGLHIVPTRLITNSRFIKIELGIGRSKKQVDKRESIKKREQDIELGRSFKLK